VQQQCGRKENKWTNVVDGLVVKEVGGDNLSNDLLQELLSEVLGGDLLGVLGRDDDGVDSDGDHGTSVLLVLDGDLGLGVRSEPSERLVSSSDGHGGVELVGEDDGEGHELLGLVSGVSEPVGRKRRSKGGKKEQVCEKRGKVDVSQRHASGSGRDRSTSCKRDRRTYMIPWSPAPWFSRSPWSRP
jgi:hypothetical protein